MSDKCSECDMPEYAHDLCHRHWARQGLELDTDQKPLTTPSVASGAKQKVGWHGQCGSKSGDGHADR